MKTVERASSIQGMANTTSADNADVDALGLTDRQRREVEYHKEYAQKHAHHLTDPMPYDMLTGRRWWNQYWEFFWVLRQQKLAGKRVLVVGCGFGGDAIRLAKLGAQVCALDISAEVLSIARQLAEREKVDIDFSMLPAERVKYPDGHFDAIVMRDIMHHVDIPAAVKELKRVSKPGATWIVNEVYSHGWTEWVRRSWLVERFLYRALEKFIYRGEPYITEDERKLSQVDLQQITGSLSLHTVKWFYVIVNRLLPDGVTVMSKADRLLLMALKPIGGLLAGRVILAGTLRQK
jgi:ubiquinone/menaquinone biosynthesis C-methylase UbiE